MGIDRDTSLEVRMTAPLDDLGAVHETPRASDGGSNAGGHADSELGRPRAEGATPPRLRPP